MKYILTVIFGLLLTASFSQDSTATDRESDMFSIDVLYGHCLLKNDFNQQFNSQQHVSFSSPIQTVGIGLSGAYVRNHRHDVGLHYSYSQVVPQKIIIHDSIGGKINGFILSIDLFGRDLLPKSKIANCILSFGFNTGRFRISTNDYKQQKNPFFSPTLSLQPKLWIGSVVLSIRADYGFDLSKSGWRSVNFSNKTTPLQLNALKQTGAIFYFSIGWVPGEKIGYVLDLTKKKK